MVCQIILVRIFMEVLYLVCDYNEKTVLYVRLSTYYMLLSGGENGTYLNSKLANISEI